MSSPDRDSQHKILDIFQISQESFIPLSSQVENIDSNRVINENDIQSDFLTNNEPDDGEELFGDDLENEYRQIPHLDIYGDTSMLDDENSINMLTIDQKIAAEIEMRQRDRLYRNSFSKIDNKKVLLYDSEDETDSFFREALNSQLEPLCDKNYDINKVEQLENIEDFRGHSVKEWVSLLSIKNEIKNRFMQFLRTFINDDGINIYREKIKKMCECNTQSLIVNYNHLATNEQVIAYFLPEAPTEMFAIMNDAAFEVVLGIFPKYQKISSDVFIRISDLPLIEEIRFLRQIHLNQLVRVSGVVTCSSGIIPQLSIIKYKCTKCSCIIGPYTLSQFHEFSPNICPDCQTHGPFEVNMEESIYRNYQRITIQESPGSISPGRLPRSKDAILLSDQVDICKPGDEVIITGIYSNTYDGTLNSRNGFPLFSTILLVNYLEKKNSKSLFTNLSEDDLKTFNSLAKDVNLYDQIISSVAPSIYGHQLIKRAISLALFGGQTKNPGNKHHIRGDINILLCGDPGTAKSQFLKYIEKTAHRPVFTTGQGASSVGLTAYVQRHPVTKEWTLEAGALVLADLGVCLIDEFDKMNDRDRTSIHEAMEQQTISISKAGIVTSLQARCSVIAAANPLGGRYDQSLTFAENVDLTDPILSRFDVLCVVRDIVDPITDGKMANFVIESHRRHHPNHLSDSNFYEGNILPNISQEVLRKYIIYSKGKFNPKLNNIDQDKISSLYADLRKESLRTGCIPITVRHIESIIRLSEAHAKMYLREYVNNEDVNIAISIILESFIDTQKFSILKNMKKAFSRFLSFKKDQNELLMFFLKQLLSEIFRFNRNRFGKYADFIEVNEEDFVLRIKHLNIDNLISFYESKLFHNSNIFYDKKRKLIIQYL